MRKRILQERNALSASQRQEWDRQILEHLVRYDQENPCAAYMCYVNYRSEVSTREFILWCLEKGRIIFVPRVFQSAEMESAEMEFYRITAWEDLTSGYQGIPEPKAMPERSFFRWLEKIRRETEEAGKPERVRLRMLMPGSVFDRAGNRIGYGGGFYDRWLAKWNHFNSGGKTVLEKIGLAYGMQIAESIPTERFDQKTDFVITENNVIEKKADVITGQRKNFTEESNGSGIIV